ncbi:MAG: AAA family ATPase [Bacteroidales bacterium]|nr:AAA family ATPase [Bacteroidales bacterium]
MASVHLNLQQSRAFAMMKSFVCNNTEQVFVLKGYAGTGKSTMVKSLIKYFGNQNISFSLLATTGRASKILSNITGSIANTVHSKIYRFTGLNQDLEALDIELSKPVVEKHGQLCLMFGLLKSDLIKEQVFIVDEASMMADKLAINTSFAHFGDGRLLSDLFNYAPQAKFIFVGDACQLPPVSQNISPALNAAYLRATFNVGVSEIELTQIMRQCSDNDILLAGQKIRKLFTSYQPQKWAIFPLKGYNNVKLHSSHVSLLSHYIESIKNNGYNFASLICHSNRQCNDITQIIRQALGLSLPTLMVGDLLMITQNNIVTGLMNGDLVVIQSLGNRYRKGTGVTMIEVNVKELFSGRDYSTLLIEDVVYANETNLRENQHQQLMIDFYRRMKAIGIKQKDARFNELMQKDTELNALRAIYGYALTCHKSQGGEWEEVYVYLDNKIQGMQRPYVYQWMYTAVTRAKQQLHLVNDWFIQ